MRKWLEQRGEIKTWLSHLGRGSLPWFLIKRLSWLFVLIVSLIVNGRIIYYKSFATQSVDLSALLALETHIVGIRRVCPRIYSSAVYIIVIPQVESCVVNSTQPHTDDITGRGGEYKQT